MRRRRILGLAVAALSATACTTDDYYGGQPVYQGTQYASARQPYLGELTGPGVALLDPWLVGTEEGRAVVTLGFTTAAEGVISEDVAHRANVWFRRYADQNCDLRLTDGEIRNGLVAAAGPFLRPEAAPGAPAA